MGKHSPEGQFLYVAGVILLVIVVMSIDLGGL